MRFLTNDAKSCDLRLIMRNRNIAEYQKPCITLPCNIYVLLWWTSNENLIRIKKENFCHCSTSPWQEEHLCSSCFSLTVWLIFSASVERLPHHLSSNSNNLIWLKKKSSGWLESWEGLLFVTFWQPMQRLSSKSSEDEFCTNNCRNISHIQQSFSGLQSHRWSFPIKICYSWVQTISLI